MEIGDIEVVGGQQYKITDIQTVDNPDGTTSVVVSYAPA